MKKIASPLMLTLSLSLFNFAYAGEDILTGDEGSACEAILCLSTGSRPNECVPPVARYFSITAKKIVDTIRARKAFLQLCPSAGETPELINAIANGAGRCDAEYLNANNTAYVPKQDSCSSRDCEKIKVILNKKPDYCAAYENNEYTVDMGVSYLGDMKHGGHWVNQ